MPKFHTARQRVRAFGLALAVLTGGTALVAQPVVAAPTAEAAAAAAQLSGPSGVEFGRVKLGVATPSPAVLRNLGGSTATGLTAKIAGTDEKQFTVGKIPSTLDAGAELSIPVTFRAYRQGDNNAELVVSSADGGTVVIPVHAYGVGPAATASTDLLDFGVVPAGTGVIKSITITNTGEGTLSFTGYPLIEGPAAADFSWSGDLTPLRPRQSAVFSVTFTPSALGTRNATIRFNGRAYRIPLSGTGRSATLGLEPSVSNLSLPGTFLGRSSEKTISLSNNGQEAATSLVAAISGPNANQFQVSSAPSSLEPGATSALTVLYKPTTRGAHTATLTFTSAQGGTATVELSGKGLGPVATPSSDTLTFGVVPVGTLVTQTVTITNTGEGNLGFAGYPIIEGPNASDYSWEGATTSQLKSSESTTFTVRFRPSKPGTSNATIRFNGRAYRIALTGTGEATPVPQ